MADMWAGRSSMERARLLHFVVVGGGPTGVEFAGELSSFISSVCPFVLFEQSVSNGGLNGNETVHSRGDTSVCAKFRLNILMVTEANTGNPKPLGFF